MVTKPAFDALPLRKDGPHGNAWGLFGDGDEMGMLNLLTPDTTLAAAGEIRDGARVPIDWPLDKMAPPCFGRASFQHHIKNKAPRSVNDDTLIFNTQITSQWDGFRHYGYQKEKLWFNGKTLEDILTTKVNGIHAWVDKGGIVGRGVLLDYAGWVEGQGQASSDLDARVFSTSAIPASVLQQVADAQGTELRQGDVLLVRTGWVRAYERLGPEQRQALAALASPPAIGLESSEATLRWLWDRGFAAVGGDQPSFEAWPCQDPDYWLHEWLLAGWGMPIGELFDLERLAEECRKRNKWSFFFSSVPVNVPGGVASTPNGVAIL